jgi:hypothetical protein
LTYVPSDDVYGDFSFVGTEITTNPPEYPVTAYNIRIEFQDNTQDPATFASGSFDQVQYIDDYTRTGSNERTYATALDAVAHGTFPPGNIIQTYDKAPGKQMLAVVSDDKGVGHEGVDIYSGFMYAVYKPDPDDPTRYDRDENSHRIGSDDYMLQDGDYVLWVIGHLYDYYTYFPDRITAAAESPVGDPGAESEAEEYGIGGD